MEEHLSVILPILASMPPSGYVFDDVAPVAGIAVYRGGVHLQADRAVGAGGVEGRAVNPDVPDGAGHIAAVNTLFDIYVDGGLYASAVAPSKSSSGYFSYTADFSH